MSDKRNCSSCKSRYREWTRMPCLNCKGDMTNWKNWEEIEIDGETEAKHDTGKPRCDLVSPSLIEAVGHIRGYGVEKYKDPDNWKKVEPSRYVAALMRHLCEYMRDPNSIDEESGLPHIWHCACNVNFLTEFYEMENKQ